MTGEQSTESQAASPAPAPASGAQGAVARLFRPVELKALSLRNRVVMAPMTRRMAADDGIPTDAIVAYYRRRARGESKQRNVAGGCRSRYRRLPVACSWILGPQSEPT